MRCRTNLAAPYLSAVFLALLCGLLTEASATASPFARQAPAAFVPSPSGTTAATRLRAETTKVEVCHFKDCKRAGGGPRLLKLINQVVEEKDLASQFTVTDCDCQGECGYGPNLVVDGKIVNNVKGRDAVQAALGIEDEE